MRVTPFTYILCASHAIYNSTNQLSITGTERKQSYHKGMQKDCIKPHALNNAASFNINR